MGSKGEVREDASGICSVVKNRQTGTGVEKGQGAGARRGAGMGRSSYEGSKEKQCQS